MAHGVEAYDMFLCDSCMSVLFIMFGLKSGSELIYEFYEGCLLFQ